MSNSKGLCLQQVPQKSIKENNKLTLVNIERILLFIPVKFPKKVNIIFKFFKNNKINNFMLSKVKFYTQASKQNTSILDVIKIKKTFPSIEAKI